jgi:hypothetical protein
MADGNQETPALRQKITQSAKLTDFNTFVLVPYFYHFNNFLSFFTGCIHRKAGISGPAGNGDSWQGALFPAKC